MSQPHPGRAERIALVAILVGALVLRLLHWLAVRDEPFVASLVVDSKEYERWAQGIVAGDWLGREAFFQAPLYPYLLALLHAVFGKGLTAIYLTQALAATAGCWALFRAGRLLLGAREGLVAAGLLALTSPCLFHDVLVLKESLAVTLGCFLLWALASARGREGWKPWLVAGLACGGLVLLRENALLVAPLLAALALVPRDGGSWRESWRPGLRPAGVFLLGILLVLSPVAVRNGVVSGDWLPTTSQGGVNLYIGNHAGASGAYDPLLPGAHDPAREREAARWVAERDAGRQLSPAEVSSYWTGRVFDWATEHPGDFLALQARKLARYWRPYEQPDTVDYYWMRTRSWVMRLPLLEFGGVTLLALAGAILAWRRKLLLRLSPAWVFALGWMLSTVAFFVFSRYRLPTVPALLLLAAIPVTALLDAAIARRRRAVLGLGLLLLVAWIGPRLLPHEPAWTTLHVNLAGMAIDDGRLDDAVREYERALEREPELYIAHLQLGRIAIQQQRLQPAAIHFKRATVVSPESPEAHAELGRVLLTAGRVGEGRDRLLTAIALDPDHADALHDLSVVAAMSGDLDRAAELNARVLELRPDDEMAQAVSRELARRRSQ